ncbi:LysM peptidoglycan-binding domain-containing protein [Shewanella psychropiezotolerans]|uniref:LysM peptidoglycan-binding domain-containing protein n=1 Tax=Shewanella psychropiezotolerans TaxID=2593655 RepID=A0ABX5WY15_9GAMM|nr:MULTISPECIES: LysM peptidoglycan-binding domain-containing protein [Shewanella]MPY26413.1 LysM peptidoglycan-binding domain-containing protein [Shewanella sp. YLB-07]QDO81921.1 LysM peptidoglycan-binding domain-containing protein [Shewanella psychropiezotolerans]
MGTPMKRLILLGLILLNCSFVFADTLTLKSGHPDSYVVEKGDTLWDISAHFLKDPWRWPKLWGANPQIANPHLIYPGDRLTLVFIDGEPRLVVKPHIRKSPAGRIMPKGGAIPAIDLALIRPYLIQNRVVDGDWFETQPMVLGGESESKHHIVGDVIYIQAELTLGDKFGVYEQGRDFVSKDGDDLGVEAILTASGRVIESGSISKVKLLSNFRETVAGNRVLPIEEDSLMSAYFMPRAAELSSPASVLASEKNLREMGKLDVVYIDKGSEDGVETGHVFSIYRDGLDIVINGDGQPVIPTERSTYENMLSSVSSANSIKMPDIYRGKLMVFKVFDKTSMGLIMVNERSVRVEDKLVKPDALLISE